MTRGGLPWQMPIQRKRKLTQILPPDPCPEYRAKQELQYAAVATDQASILLESKHPDMQIVTLVTGRSIGNAAEFVATFKQNPGRGLVSILLGVILGLIVAWALCFNALRVVIETVQSASNRSSATQWGIVLPGLRLKIRKAGKV